MNTRPPAVEVKLNGQSRTVPADQSLQDLIESSGLPPQTTLVEYNGQALFRSDWEHVRLKAGDCLEILRIVAGG